MSVAEAVRAAWPRARARWSRFVLLGDPVDASGPPTVAWIDLRTRQVSLDFARIERMGVVDCVEGLLAHEIGHHLCWPGTLAADARMRLLERRLLPFENYSLVNTFTDLLVNERLGHDEGLRAQLATVYRAFTREREFTRHWHHDPAFPFVLSVYETLWDLPPGDLVGPSYPSFAAAYPSHRAEAQWVAEDLFALGPNVYTQLLFFLSVAMRYVRGDLEKPQILGPHRCGQAQPTPEDWADALAPDGKEREAVKRAVASGWFDRELADRLERALGPDALAERLAGLFGTADGAAQAVPEVMAAWYRLQAERYLLRPPPQPISGEAVVPTTAEEWEPGDPVRDIDWVLTLLQRGDALGAALPLKRSPVAEVEGYDVPLWQPRIEIYLDVSGSMPDPRSQVNAMTLAAQILVTAAIKAGGRARAVLYSHVPVPFWEWTRSAGELSRFLMHYVGGGTAFPFGLLERSVAECGREQPIRVVITDRDFDGNHDAAAANARVFAEAARASPRCVLLQHQPDPDVVPRYRAAGATVVAVQRMEAFPQMATALALALFPEDERGAV